MGQTTATSLTSLFRTIPPERVGTTGDYDHQGLAKRVILAFNQTFEPHEVSHLRVTQRGAVVVLVGNIATQRLLVRLVHTAMGVYGAVDVEVNGVSLADSLKTYIERPTKAALGSLLSAVTQS